MHTRTSWLGATALLLLAFPAGCAAEGARADGPAQDPRAPFADGTGPRMDETAERVLARFRDYVYATYTVEAERTDAALDRLRAARKGLADAMAAASLAREEQSVASAVGALKDYLRERGDLVFVPIGGEASGVLLVRVRERRTVEARKVAGLSTGYKVVLFEDVAVLDDESWRRRATPGAPPARPVALASGKTLFVDRGVALRLAREVVIPRAERARALEERLRKGERLDPAETKDLLRHRALAKEIAEGDLATAKAIEREEELRMAALFARAPADPRELATPEAQADLERRATLAAMVEGEPRYHLASALAAVIAAKDAPPGRGAAQALEVFQRADVGQGLPSAISLPSWSPADLVARAKEALGGR